MTNIKIKVNTHEVLKGKFKNTLSTIEGFYKEAEGDCKVKQTYSANAVYNRMSKIKFAMEEDLANLSHDITIDSIES